MRGGGYFFDVRSVIGGVKGRGREGKGLGGYRGFSRRCNCSGRSWLIVVMMGVFFVVVVKDTW